MFTGIIEAVGEVAAVDGARGGRTFVIGAPFAGELAAGQSVAVDGACLTVRAADTGTFTVDAGASTLERTVAGRYERGTAVNLERALRVGDRLDGHLVQGHVDGVATLRGRRASGETRFLEFELPKAVFAATVLHGSIALNGVSLTVNDLRGEGRCELAIVPYTWERTNFPALETGDPVNAEADLVGKYVARILEATGSLPRSPLAHAP
ncbi:MAG: riboflavin synthase [Gemmatimonadota bacterium]|nr:riboflavin synthase [Gemmatimonadota bacterium]MDE2870692.1 riboflavin synthase [Gemmatimonadota bacterium]